VKVPTSAITHHIRIATYNVMSPKFPTLNFDLACLKAQFVLVHYCLQRSSDNLTAEQIKNPIIIMQILFIYHKVLAGALGLLSWHMVKLCIVHGRFPADNPLRKNHGQILYPPIRMLSEPFRLFACGFRAGAEEDSL